MQQTLGNQGVLRRLQAKLAINQPGDVYEQEADKIAEQVMAAPINPDAGAAARRIQRLSGQSAGQMTEPASVETVLAGPGRPLEPALRQDMEQHFGHDFASVRVHTGAAAARSAQDVNAHAYTVGRNIVFAEGRYRPATDQGRGLLAHELVHTIQQCRGAAPAIQRRRRPDETRKSPNEAPAIVMIVAYSRSPASAVATLSNGRVEPVKIDRNTLEPGEYTFELDRSAVLHYRLVDRRKGQDFVWRKKRAYRWADKVRVFIRMSPQERIAALPSYIRNFLTTTRSRAPKASESDLVSIAAAGRILETYGVTEDELSLLELAEADRRGIGGAQKSGEDGDPVGWALSFVAKRQSAAAEAANNREVLKQSAARFDSAWRWRKNPAAATFERALEIELRAVATAILNATEAAIYRMDRQYIGDYQPEGLGPGFLADKLDVLRADLEIRKVRKELKHEEAWKPPRPPYGEKAEEAERQRKKQYYQEGISSAYLPWYSREHVRRHLIRLRMLRDELNELVKVKTHSGLPLGSLPHASAERLLAAKTASGAQSVLRDMLYNGRVAVRDARKRLDDVNALFGADIVIATEKVLLGVKPGSVLDQIIDDIVHERTAPSVWDRIIGTLSFVAMFIPGGFGVVVRLALATVQSVRSVESFAGQEMLNRAGLSSVEPSGGALATELIVTTGGAVLDAATMAKAAGRAKLLDLGEGATAPTEMRGIQLGDEPHSIQIRAADVAAPATDAELEALANTEASVLGRRTRIMRDLDRLKLERGGLDEAGGLRGQLAKRDRLLKSGTLSEAGKHDVRQQIKDLEMKLDAKDAEIGRLEAELGNLDDELAYVRGRLGSGPAGQPPQLAAGRLREDEVAEAFNLGPKNTAMMRDPNPGGADFIPDFVDGNPESLVWGRPYHFREVKNWAKMPDTGNLKAMLDYVSDPEIPDARLTIYFRSNTRMSGPLKKKIEELMLSGKVNLVPFATH